MDEQQKRVDELTGEAERFAADLAQRSVFPTHYAQLVDLLALAYIQGGRDALQWTLDNPLAGTPTE
jgi:hypothetical protein